MTPRRSPVSERRSFTLVEMVVAIGVIAVLAVLTVSASVALAKRNEIRQTENVLKLLDLALQEWEAQSDRRVSWGKEDVPYADAVYDMLDGTPHLYTGTEMLRVIRRSTPVQPILAQIDPQFVHVYDDSDVSEPPPWLASTDPDDPDPRIATVRDVLVDYLGELAVLDAWETPIRVVHPGRLFDFDAIVYPEDSTEAPDPDGTIRLRSDWGGTSGYTYAVEEIYGTAQNRRLLFVSAGPDGRFGDLSAADGEPVHEYAHDNVYSYAVEDLAHD